MAISKRSPRGGLKQNGHVSRGGRRRSVSKSRGKVSPRYITSNPSGVAKAVRPPKTALRRMSGKGVGHVSSF